MIKLITSSVVSLLLLLTASSVFATSIVYHGFACQNPSKDDVSTPSATPLDSRFTVDTDIGNGLYRVILTGGIPRTNGDDICIDSETSMGFEGLALSAGVFGGEPPTPLTRKTSIDGVAHFNGSNLIISINSIYSDQSGHIIRSQNGAVASSIIKPVSNTLILKYDISRNAFVLENVIRNSGFVNATGYIGQNTYYEFIYPSGGVGALPLFHIPSQEIVYYLE